MEKSEIKYLTLFEHSRKRGTFGCLVLATVFLSFGRSASSMQTTNQRSGVLAELDKLGERLGCYFTFERMGGTATSRLDESSLSMLRTKEPLNAEVTTVSALVSDLRAKLKDSRIVLDNSDKSHPVIQVIDERLANTDDYVLDKKIDLSYTGVIGGIATEIQKSTPQVERPVSGGMPDELYNDNVTRVSVNARNKTVRHIITHAVDLDNYSRIIWTSKTYQQKDGTWTTQLRFTGPRE